MSLMKNLLLKIYRSKYLSWGVVFILCLFFFSIISAPPSSAQSTYNPRENAGYVFNTGQFNNVTTVFIDALAGSPVSDSVDETTGYVRRNPGAIAYISNLTGSLYSTQPASGIVWAQGEVNKIKGLETFTVQAQVYNEPSFATDRYSPGLGYTILRPVNALWQWARNLTYLFYVFILIVLSFFILFRKSLGGQAVVTITNSIPSIIWSLILVTLSYAIVGAFVDAITLGSNFVYSAIITAPGAPGRGLVGQEGFLDTSGGLDLTGEAQNYLQPNDQSLSIWSIWSISDSQICGGENDCSQLNIAPNTSSNNPLSQLIGSVLSNGESAAVGLSGFNLIQLILVVTVFSAAFKLFMSLLTNYVVVIVYAVIAPFIFLTAALPQKTSDTISTFLRTLASISVTFILVYALFLVMVVIGQSNRFPEDDPFQGSDQIEWVPPLLGYETGQFVSGGDGSSTSLVKAILMYFLFLFAPNIPEMVKEIFSVPPLNKYVAQTLQDIRGTGNTIRSGLTGGWNILKNGRG